MDEWEHKNKVACEKGHFGHLYAQNLWNGEIYQEDIKSGLEDAKMPLEKVKQQALNFKQDYDEILEHLADEFVIGSEEYDIASAIDHLFINKATGGLVLVDYKTNSFLSGHNKKAYKKAMKVPLSHLNDDALHHYYIQLSIYRYFLEKYAGLEVSEMFIVYLSENIENYEIIEIPYLKDEVIKILENRRIRKMGKSIPVLIIGRSGSGKSASLRNFKKEEISLINPLAKRLPFKSDIVGLKSSNYELIKKFIAETPKKVIVVDDSNYLLTIAMIGKAKEKGYDKFTDMAIDYWNLINFIKNLDGDKRVYFMSHEEIDDYGNVKVKTIGKMLDQQCCIEGLYTIVLRTEIDNGSYHFLTQNSGNDIVKTPIGMFENKVIDNDLKFVDDTIKDYYGMIDKNKESEEK